MSRPEAEARSGGPPVPQARERWAVSPWNRYGVEDSTAFAKPPLIADCTLRDGEQQAGVVFSYDDKITLARRLDAIGVADIEAGTPAVSDEDRSAIEAIAHLGLNAMVTAVARATEADIDLVSSCGCAGVRVSFPISERQRRAKLYVSNDEFITQALKFCEYAKLAGLQVIFSPYDTTRCDLDLLRRLLRTFARERCVDRVRLVDTVGAATPEAVRF
jgi:isopropylmalate/homocitrate/citramalate synthase